MARRVRLRWTERPGGTRAAALRAWAAWAAEAWNEIIAWRAVQQGIGLALLLVLVLGSLAPSARIASIHMSLEETCLAPISVDAKGNPFPPPPPPPPAPPPPGASATLAPQLLGILPTRTDTWLLPDWLYRHSPLFERLVVVDGSRSLAAQNLTRRLCAPYAPRVIYLQYSYSQAAEEAPSGHARRRRLGGEPGPAAGGLPAGRELLAGGISGADGVRRRLSGSVSRAGPAGATADHAGGGARGGGDRGGDRWGDRWGAGGAVFRQASAALGGSLSAGRWVLQAWPDEFYIQDPRLAAAHVDAHLPWADAVAMGFVVAAPTPAEAAGLRRRRWHPRAPAQEPHGAGGRGVAARGLFWAGGAARTQAKSGRAAGRGEAGGAAGAGAGGAGAAGEGGGTRGAPPPPPPVSLHSGPPTPKLRTFAGRVPPLGIGVGLSEPFGIGAESSPLGLGAATPPFGIGAESPPIGIGAERSPVGALSLALDIGADSPLLGMGVVPPPRGIGAEPSEPLYVIAALRHADSIPQGEREERLFRWGEGSAWGGGGEGGGSVMASGSGGGGGASNGGGGGSARGGGVPNGGGGSTGGGGATNSVSSGAVGGGNGAIQLSGRWPIHSSGKTWPRGARMQPPIFAVRFRAQSLDVNLSSVPGDAGGGFGGGGGIGVRQAERWCGGMGMGRPRCSAPDRPGGESSGAAGPGFHLAGVRATPRAGDYYTATGHRAVCLEAELAARVCSDAAGAPRAPPAACVVGWEPAARFEERAFLPR